jgi:hypothetical protein
LSSRDEKAFVVFSGGNDRAVIGFLRAMRQCGKRALIVARTVDDAIFKTRYRHDVKWTRSSHDLTMPIFLECVGRVREEAAGRPLVVFPSTEYLNAFLLRHRPEIEAAGCEVPLVDESIYNLLTGKRAATDFFSAAGFSVPREYRAGGIDAPAVAKPVTNVSAGRSLYPILLETRDDLDAFLRSADAGQFFFQEFVRGESVYLLFYLPRDGGAHVCWSQRNLMQQPGGKSILLAEKADFHRSSAASDMIEALREHHFWGLGMIEVIRAPGRDVFIEMNPRVWGPIQFCNDQHQPLLHAFIGDVLHGDPGRFSPAPARREPRDSQYLWLGGIADTLAAGQKPVWHATRKSMTSILAAAVGGDVYLRADSWRYFIFELVRALKTAWHRERTES